MQMLTVKELSEILHIGRDKAYALMHAKAFPAMKIGGRYYVSKSALEKWVEVHTHKTFV